MKKWPNNYIKADREKKLAKQEKEVADYDDKLTAAGVLSNYLDGEINHIVYKLGKSFPDFYYNDPNEECALTDEEITNLLEKLHTYTICRDIAKEKNKHWVKYYWARKHNSRETWYFDVNPSEPLWFYITKGLIKVIFYVSVFSAALIYLYSTYV